MKHLAVFTFAAASVVAAGFRPLPTAAEPAPSRDWVRAFVTNYIRDNVSLPVSESNGVTTITTMLSDGSGAAELSYEPMDWPALVVTNSVSATVTNGFTFAYVTNGLYSGDGEMIQATATNFVHHGEFSTVINGLDTFPGDFSVIGGWVTKAQAEAIR